MQIDVDERTRSKLRKIGVNSVDDLKDLEARKVDLKAATGSDIDYGSLARRIRQSRRASAAPSIEGVSMSMTDGAALPARGGPQPRRGPDVPTGGRRQRPAGRGAARAARAT